MLRVAPVERRHERSGRVRHRAAPAHEAGGSRRPPGRSLDGHDPEVAGSGRQTPPCHSAKGRALLEGRPEHRSAFGSGRRRCRQLSREGKLQGCVCGRGGPAARESSRSRRAVRPAVAEPRTGGSVLVEGDKVSHGLRWGVAVDEVRVRAGEGVAGRAPAGSHTSSGVTGCLPRCPGPIIEQCRGVLPPSGGLVVNGRWPVVPVAADRRRQVGG